MSKLNPKQKRFCHEYVIDHNATQACIRAGYKEKNAAVTGCENLTKPNIKEYIAELEETIFEKLGITQEKVLRERSAIAFSRIDNHVEVDEGGFVKCKTFDEMDDNAIACIKKVKHKKVIKETKDGDLVMCNDFEFELWDKQKELDKLAINLGLDKDQGIDLSNLRGLTINFVESGDK